MTDRKRLVAKILATPLRLKVRHYVGLPPQLSGANNREEMPRAAILSIEVEDDGVFLYRFAADGAFAGDTWHQTVEEAQEQATFEFASAISNWIAIPPDEEDAVAFALKANE
jgi:hypothetical protein